MTRRCGGRAPRLRRSAFCGATPRRAFLFWSSPWPASSPSICRTLVPAYARLGLGLDAGGFGLLMSAVGAGACLGGLLQWRRPAASNWRPLTAATGLGLCLAALSAIHQLTPAALVLAGFGVCSATVFSSASAAVQSLIPDPLRNAATSLQVMIVQGTNPLGSALTGWALERFGASAGTAMLGAATLAAVMLLAVSHRRDLSRAGSSEGAGCGSSATAQ